MDIQIFEKDSTRANTTQIDLDIIIPSAHQTRYKLNPSYAIVVKQDIDKLLTTRFIEYVKETTWLSPIVVVPKKNGNLRICINVKKLNGTIKKIHTHYLS
jgi:hypothetical protein